MTSFMTRYRLTHVRFNDDGSQVERPISASRGKEGTLQVDLSEDVRVGDVIEDRFGDNVKRMQIRDVIPQRYGGLVGPLNDHLELRYELKSLATLERPKQFDASMLHPSIAAVAQERLRAGNGNDAVFRAYELVETRIQELTGLTDIGKDLATAVFRPTKEASLLDIADSELSEKRQNSEREGYKFLFYGAAIGIRNTHAHGSRPEIPPADAFELLAFASHLMRRLDLAEQRLADEARTKPSDIP